MADRNELRRLLSSAITILECVEDGTEDLQMRIRLLDMIDIFRTRRRELDSATIADDNESLMQATKALRQNTEDLQQIQSELQESLAETEARLERIGHIAKLIKFVL